VAAKPSRHTATQPGWLISFNFDTIGVKFSLHSVIR